MWGSVCQLYCISYCTTNCSLILAVDSRRGMFSLHIQYLMLCFEDQCQKTATKSCLIDLPVNIAVQHSLDGAGTHLTLICITNSGKNVSNVSGCFCQLSKYKCCVIAVFDSSSKHAQFMYHLFSNTLNIAHDLNTVTVSKK